MNEAIEYAEMLEIPVSTVNVIHKKRGRKRKGETRKPADVKDTLIEQVNSRMTAPEPPAEITAEANAFAEGVNSQGDVHFDVPERIDTVRVYSAYDQPFLGDGKLRPREYPMDGAEEGEAPVPFAPPRKMKKAKNGAKIAIGIEFTACCALCGAIFLTNVFMPSSAINTFFRFLGDGSAKTDARTYTDFTLTPVVSELANPEFTLSQTGVLTFKEQCHVYPAVDGKVTAVTKADSGYYTVKIAHSDSFTGVIEGLQQVYYQEGDTVKANVPLGYSGGETDVQITMYSFGELLNCFELTEENCLAWVTQEQ